MRIYIIFIVGILLTLVIFFILKVKGIIDYNLLSIFLIIPSGILPGVVYSIFHSLKQKDLNRNRIIKSGILGSYFREDIGQDNTDDCSNMKEKNIGLEVNVQYSKENDLLVIYADYWKHKDGLDLVKAELKVIDIIPFNARGIYKYVKSNNENLGCSGKYEINQTEKNKLNVRFWHEFPRKSANNPDMNRGWEIWKKID